MRDKGGTLTTYPSPGGNRAKMTREMTPERRDFGKEMGHGKGT